MLWFYGPEKFPDLSRNRMRFLKLGPKKPFLVNWYLKTEVYSPETSSMKGSSVLIKNI